MGSKEDASERDKILTKALERGKAWYAKTLKEDCWDTKTFSELTGQTEQWLADLADHNAQYLYLEDEEGVKYWPKIQVDLKGKVPEYFDVINGYLRFKGYGYQELHYFWVSCPVGASKPNIDRLFDGEYKAVVRDARTFWEQGAR